MLKLLFTPTAWHQRFKQSYPGLTAESTLSDRACCRPDLLIKNLLLYPLVTAGLVTAVLGATGLAWKHVQLGMICALVWHSVTALACSLWISVAVSGLTGMVCGLAGGLLLCGLHSGLGAVLAAALFAFGLTGNVLIGLEGQTTRLWREIGSITAGLLISVLVLGTGYWATNNLLPEVFKRLDLDNPDLQLLGMSVATGLLTGALRGGWALAGGLLCATVFGAFFSHPLWMPATWPQALRYAVQDTMLAAALALLVSGLYALSFVPALRLAGMRAGVTAGSLGLLGVTWLITDFSAPLLWWLPAALVLGLTCSWWLPLLSYPLLEVWHVWLFCREKRGVRRGRMPCYIRRHAGFWTEQQRLPWVSLVPHLSFIYPYDPSGGRRMLEQLSQRGQHRMVQAVRIELDIQALSAAQTLEAVSKVHHSLHNVKGDKPEQVLIRRFETISRDVEVALAQNAGYTQRLMLRESEERLNRLILDLNQLFLVRRFHALAVQWRDCIATAGDERDTAANLAGEIHNPYVVGIPLTTKQEIFIGRRDVMARIEKVLLAPRAPPVLLYGQRRTGKTSLLNNLSRLLSSRFVFAYLDFQSPRMLSGQLPTMLEGIVFAVRTAVQRSMPCPALILSTLQADPLGTFARWLDELDLALGDHTLLLALDEFTVLEDKVTDAKVLDTLLSLIRHIIQHRPGWRILLAGAYAIEELRHWSGYLVNVQTIHLGHLSPEEARHLIEDPEPRLRYSAVAVERILTLTDCHPALMQLLCSELVDLKNSQPAGQRLRAEIEDVEQAAVCALRSGAFYFSDMLYHQIDASALAMLRDIAHGGEGAVVTHADLSARPDWEESLLQLQRRELVKDIDNGYGFRVELMRRALLSNGGYH